MLTSGKATRFDPYFLPQYLRLNEAIERLTDMVAHDRARFAAVVPIFAMSWAFGYFALFADRKLYDYFVACSTQAAPPDEQFAVLVPLGRAGPRGERPRFEMLTGANGIAVPTPEPREGLVRIEAWRESDRRSSSMSPSSLSVT